METKGGAPTGTRTPILALGKPRSIRLNYGDHLLRDYCYCTVTSRIYGIRLNPVDVKRSVSPRVTGLSIKNGRQHRM